MHARHLLGKLAIVRFQNSFKFSRALYLNLGIPLNIVLSIYIFDYFLKKNICCGYSLEARALLMSIHKLCFLREI